MKASILAAAAALLLTGCASTGQAVLKNVAGCERHYDGAVSAGLTGATFAGTIKIDCAPQGAPPPP